MVGRKHESHWGKELQRPKGEKLSLRRVLAPTVPIMSLLMPNLREGFGVTRTCYSEFPS